MALVDSDLLQWVRMWQQANVGLHGQLGLSLQPDNSLQLLPFENITAVFLVCRVESDVKKYI